VRSGWRTSTPWTTRPGCGTSTADEVYVWGRPATSPWTLQALRALTPEQEQRLGAAYSFNDDVLRLAGADGAAPPLEPISELDEDRGSLTFDPANLPTAGVLQDRGVDSTREVWAGLVGLWWPELAQRIVLDPDTELFAAYGQIESLRGLQHRLERLFTDETALTLALADVPLDWLES
jgi:hypothetical protein